MNKKFSLKVYEDDGVTLAGTITSDGGILKNEIKFSSKINGGFGQCVLDLNFDFDDFDTDLLTIMNIVDIYEQDENNPSGRIIYTGFISVVEPYTNGAIQGVRVTLLGLISLLSFAFYKDGTNFTVTHTNDDPAVIMKAIIDHFNTIYANTLISYDVGGTTVETVGTNVTYEFNDAKWVDALQQAFSLVDPGWWWSIDRIGILYLKQVPSSPTHIFTLKKDVERFEAPSDSEEVVNKVTVEYDGGTEEDSDATSISLYGTREKLINDQSITTAATAQQRVAQELEDNKDEKINARLVINSTYDIESIKVGDTCSIRNIDKNSVVFEENMLIVSVAYTAEKVSLELKSVQRDFGDRLVSLIQQQNG